MKTKFKLIYLPVVIILIFTFLFSGCFSNNDNYLDETTYTIMYNNGIETKTLQVKYGEVYNIKESVPQKIGYEFIGYFDAETGGTQYISSSGMSLKPFDDRKNIILYPQFKANEYSIFLDYGEADNEQNDKITVKFGEQIPALPSDLTIGGKGYMVFEGWYTQPNCNGQLIAGANGVSNIVINEAIVNLFNSNKSLTLYAGFKTLTYKLTFYSQDGQRVLQNAVVNHGTNFNDLTLDIKDDDLIVMSWSENINGSVFTGQITKNTSLYAINYGITVSYNTNGGSLIGNKVVKIGDEIPLPDAYRDNYRFTGWTYNGQRIESLLAPDKNITLVAQWIKTHYSVYFNSNGGSAVANQSVLIGHSFSVPTISRVGYNFLGWYDALNNKYEGTVMPHDDLILTAKWSARSYTIGLNANGGNIDVNSKSVTYGNTFTLPIPLRNGYAFNGWYTGQLGGVQITGVDGVSLNPMTETKDLTLYAQWAKLEDYNITFTRESCKLDNGYNPNSQGTEKDILAHSQFNLIELVLVNCIKNANGTYYVPQGNNLELSVKVLQDVSKLPVGPQLGSVNWTVHYVNDDNYIDEVYGTNISGKAIHYGAYYIKLNYADGSFSEFNDVNFLKGATKNQLDSLLVKNDTDKVLKSAEIVCVYEIFYDYMTGIFDWDGTKCRSNWRCSTVIQFETR